MGLADKAALLVRTRSEAALELLFEQVATLLATADVVDLKAFDESSGTRATIEHDDSRVGSVRLTQRSRSPYLTLDGTWDDYTKSRSQRFRKQLKRSARLLGEEGDWAVTRMREGDDARAWMAELLAVNDASWKAARGTNLFRCPEIRAFFEELVPEMAARGLVDLHLLRLNGEAVAYELCFRLGGTLFAYNAGYLESLEHLSLGTLNTAAVIESAFERGFAEYDMLRGDESYKLRWSGSHRTEWRAVLTAGRAYSRLYSYLGLHLKERLKRSKAVVELDDRLSGILSRFRYGK
jgi:CelD/BcsL family acetyltransferase involved in cellulose biosynthesis